MNQQDGVETRGIKGWDDFLYLLFISGSGLGWDSKGPAPERKLASGGKGQAIRIL